MSVASLSSTAVVLVALCILLGVVHYAVVAMPASPGAFEEIQSDGINTGPLFLRGVPAAHWYEDSEGYVVCPLNDRNPNVPAYRRRRRWFYCVVGPNGKWQILPNLQVGPALQQVGGQAIPAAVGLKKKSLPTPEQFLALCGDFCLYGQQESSLIGRTQRDSKVNHVDATRLRGNNQKPRRLERTLKKVEGTLKNLVVIFKFADHADWPVPSQSDIDILMNAPGGHPELAPTGSVRDVFIDNSYGNLTLESTVAEWVTLDPLYTQAYCAGENYGLEPKFHDCLVNALDKVDITTNFTLFDENKDTKIDAITFLHSGYGAERGGEDQYGNTEVDRIWSHKWALYTQNNGTGWISNEGVCVYNYHISPAIWGLFGSEIGHIGVIAHETGHFLGLPDLYGGGWGLGGWSLMSYGAWGFDNSQLYPSQLDPFCKELLGWGSPVELKEYSPDRMLPRAYDNPSNQYYKIASGYKTDEYLLIEYRTKTGFDFIIPQEGLLIYHVDHSSGYSNPSWPGRSGFPLRHNKVSLVQPDGLYELEKWASTGNSGDVFHAGGITGLGPGFFGTNHPNTDSYQGRVTETGHAISDIHEVVDPSATGGKVMSFDFTVCWADGQCRGAETCGLCPNECVFSANTCCGNGECETGETATNCPRDCFEPLYINAGGPDVWGEGNRLWKADHSYNTGLTYGIPATTQIGNTQDDDIFCTERWDPLDEPGLELMYNFEVPNGTYSVSLHFAEIYFLGNGSRIFDVMIEGNIEFSDVDIFAEVGRRNALNKSAEVNVDDNVLTIGFLHKVDNPKISAIEIVQAQTASAISDQNVVVSLTGPAEILCKTCNNFTVTIDSKYNSAGEFYANLLIRESDIGGNNNLLLHSEIISESGISGHAFSLQRTVELCCDENRTVFGSVGNADETSPSDVVAVVSYSGTTVSSSPTRVKCFGFAEGACTGDPHIKTWGGHQFSYHGECDLVLAQSNSFGSGLGFHLHLRTTIHKSWSFVEEAALKIGDDILEVSAEALHFNSEEIDYEHPGVTLAGSYPVETIVENWKIHHKELERKRVVITLGESEYVHFYAYKNHLFVKVNGSSSHFYDSVGLMGQHYSDQRVARDGLTHIEDIDEFGQEWQVSNKEPQLFRTIRAPQFPEQCRLPPPDVQQMSRRMAEDAMKRPVAEKACAEVSIEDVESCIYDVIATGDPEIAYGYL